MRIIAGTAGRRKLKTLPGSKTRPTADKVKGAVFNVLGQKVVGARVLDLFAGSGALALEALSRGADFAVLVDNNQAACQIIHENIMMTGFEDRTKTLRGDGLKLLEKMQKESFDLVFIDPPYNQGLSRECLEIISCGNYLASKGVIIVETSREEEIPVEIGYLSLRKQSRYGDTLIWYYQPTETGGN